MSTQTLYCKSFAVFICCSVYHSNNKRKKKIYWLLLTPLLNVIKDLSSFMKHVLVNKRAKDIAMSNILLLDSILSIHVLCVPSFSMVYGIKIERQTRHFPRLVISYWVFMLVNLQVHYVGIIYCPIHFVKGSVSYLKNLAMNTTLLIHSAMMIHFGGLDIWYPFTVQWMCFWILT